LSITIDYLILASFALRAKGAGVGFLKESNRGLPMAILGPVQISKGESKTGMIRTIYIFKSNQRLSIFGV
jgi:hypothetical protein